MPQIAFDTLTFANQLKAAGVEPQQAEAQAHAHLELLNSLMSEKLASKTELKEEIFLLRSEVREDFAKFRAEVRSDMSSLENRLLKHANTTTYTAVAILGSLTTLLHFFR